MCQGFVAAHIAAIIATTWILMLNGLVGYQLLDDGTAMSLGLILVSAAILFIGTGFIALDTGFSWTGTLTTRCNLTAATRYTHCISWHLWSSCSSSSVWRRSWLSVFSAKQNL